MDGTEIDKEYGDNEPPAPAGKQGHSFCGFCCDMRRAVMIINVVSILNFLFQAAMIIGAMRYADDDEAEKLSVLEHAFRGVIIMSSFGVFVSLYAIYGAYMFRVIPVGVQILYTAIYWLATNTMQQRSSAQYAEYNHLWFNWVITFIMSLFFIYPHVMLLTELRAGIMTANTYPREKQCCCL